MRFCVLASATTPGSLLGSSSTNEVLSLSCEAKPKPPAKTSAAPTRMATGCLVSHCW